MEREAITMLVASNIEAAMAKRGTNAAEVARKAGLNPTAVYDILKGKSRNPRLDTLYKIATQGLGVPFSSLFFEPEDHDLDNEIMEAIRCLPVSERSRILAVARAFSLDV
ncbi:hypothetical protein BV509_05230 [Rhodovulum sulfidophilum]|uniref:Helix-turn-helix transcriptional regulator n=1 Tax=Rhodovulum visakhapatnamense TaxID=364297 RepID=A0ABS1RI60_9RHOB|nr:helix-turn-helix transcriptional regulator [Rhodovulum visakhapatnamense]MBL3570293.1 helix-turn-helix transcriptional regulator [Rhodovulum visakhapatnamense]MBL3578955.1 helix-turn-helix transcriptional regulator [Rhodovulum visakhapatnamense]OLS43797.1 hypothetical protein BV509_05230 [Rhodovulum sulfidophilum]